MIAPTLTTERLTLRAYTLEDFERLAALFETPRARFMGGPLPRKQVWNGWISTIGQWSILGMGAWAVDLTATGECIGEVAITRPLDYPETELGWLLYDGFEGFGYAFEAAQAAKAFALSSIRPLSLVSYIDPDNQRSIRLAERLGAVRDTAAATPNNDPCLVYRYEIPGSDV